MADRPRPGVRGVRILCCHNDIEWKSDHGGAAGYESRHTATIYVGERHWRNEDEPCLLNGVSLCRGQVITRDHN